MFVANDYEIWKDHREVRVSVYRLWRRRIGHVHHGGVADVQLPRALHHESVSAGHALPHRGGFPSVVSHAVRSPQDVTGAVELFRTSYELAKEREAEHAARTNTGVRKEAP